MRYREPNSKMFNSPELISLQIEASSSQPIESTYLRANQIASFKMKTNYSFMISSVIACNTIKGIQIRMSQHTVISSDFIEIFLFEILHLG